LVARACAYSRATTSPPDARLSRRRDRRLARWRITRAHPPRRDRSREYLILGLITLLGAALRIYRLDTDLWIDEIGSFQYAMSVSVGELFRTFSSPNQHLLNSLLERITVALLGEHDWTVRLPAAVFGIATVPAMYWLARPIMRGWQSLAVAFLTAVSYHHIWFSQNGRGYSGYLLFSVIATGALFRLTASPRRRWVAVYVVSAVLALSSLIIAAFVMIAHVLLATAVVLVRRRRAEPVAPLIRHLVAAFGITAAVSLAIYGPTAIELLRVVGTAYVREGTGFRPISLEFARETLRGLGAGFGSLALVGAVPFLLLVAIGTLSLMRRGWLVVLTFVLALGMMAAVVVLAGWLTSPRFFILVVPLAFLVAVESLDLVAGLLSRLLSRTGDAEKQRRAHGALAGVAVAICAVAIGFGLPRYYAVPKQSFRAALSAFAARARPGDALVAVYQADRGFEYYTRRLGLTGDGRYYFTRTVPGFDSLGTALAGRRVYLATTFERAFKLESPALWKRVEDGWKPAETFPATIGYGEITLWEPK
jgi:4-amino-4-deoxy-L-arabinose transferase-like glycosyltransferase